MANDDTPPQFEPIDVAWGQTVILQELMIQLIQSGALPVQRAQRVFDSALQRTMKAAGQAPGATRFVQHVHDMLQLGDYFRASASKPERAELSPPGPLEKRLKRIQ